MSKASEYARSRERALKAVPAAPTFEQPGMNAEVDKAGYLYLKTDGTVCWTPNHAVALGRWLLATFEEEDGK